MESYGWDNFTKEEYFGALVDFFNNILSVDENGVKNREWSSVVFISRKAYCLFLLFKNRGLIAENGYQIYSDRYVMKSFNRNLFKEQKICLVDDTISTGKHFADIYDMIKKRTNVQKIFSYVFIEDEAFRTKNKGYEMMKEREVEIVAFKRMSSSAVLRFCSIETLVMHEECIPYAIELPVIFENGKKYISLTSEEFERLKEEDGAWNFLPTNQFGFNQAKISNAVMVMRNNSIIRNNPNFIFSFCTRLQITQKDDEYRIVALPFAVLKSVKFDDLLFLFEILYSHTEYGEQMKYFLESLDDTEDMGEMLYTALYRAVVFNFSQYIGESFIQYLNEIKGYKAVDMTKEFYLYNYEQSFLDSTNNTLKSNRRQYMINLLTIPEFEVINRKHFLTNYVKRYRNLACDYKTVFLYILGLISEMRYGKREKTQDVIEAQQWVKFITIEELWDVLRQTFPNVTDKYIKDLLLSCVCAMLEQSKLANEIYYEKSRKVVYRGFKYGENSEAIWDLSAKVFYAGVSTFYDVSKKCGNLDNYEKNYNRFLIHLQFFLLEYGLFKEVLTLDELKIYSIMFEKKDDEILEQCIENKRFLLDDTKHPYYIEKLKEYIATADIYS